MLLGYALVLPSLLVFGTFIFYPFVKNFWLGLYRTPPFPNLPRTWVGLSQYRDVLTSQLFTNSFKVTVEFVVLTVPVGHRARPAARRARAPAAPRHRDLPHDLLVDGRDLGRGRVA